MLYTFFYNYRHRRKHIKQRSDHLRERHHRGVQPRERHITSRDIDREVLGALLLAAREDPRLYRYGGRRRSVPGAVLPVLAARVS